jgi:hypothetical protein
MDVFFILTMDVEEEWEWEKGFPVLCHSVKNSERILEFQKFCDRIGIRPTYFINWSIVTDDESVKLFDKLSKDGSCEIGAHIHPWNTPPCEEESNEKNSHLINLPKNLRKEKLTILTNEIQNRLNQKPVSFRAGRWGMNGELLKQIAELGYKYDSSLIPFFTDSSFSYRKAPLSPYWPSYNDFIKEGEQRDILEIPVTAGFNRKNFYLCDNIYETLASKIFKDLHFIGILDKIKVLKKIQFSPELSDSDALISLINACLKNKFYMFNMFLHSSSFLPGGSPYARNKYHVELMYKRIEEVVRYLREKVKVHFYTLSEFSENHINGGEL